MPPCVLNAILPAGKIMPTFRNAAAVGGEFPLNPNGLQQSEDHPNMKLNPNRSHDAVLNPRPGRVYCHGDFPESDRFRV